MTIAITGATGQLGRLVIDSLKRKVPAESLRALTRSPAKAEGLGVAVREADYSRPETLGPALVGVETLLLISGSEVGQREAQHRAVIDAARAAGVGRVVYTSLLHADRSALSLGVEHRATEAMLAGAGFAVTLLRNGWYTENYAGAIGGALASGALYGSAGAGRISAAARADYAEAAAVVLAGAGHEGKIYELAGDAAFTLADLAAEVSRQAGREIPYVNLPEGEYARALAGHGLPEGLAAMIAGWDTAIAGGALYDAGRQLSALIGRPTVPMAETVAAVLAAAG